MRQVFIVGTFLIIAMTAFGQLNPKIQEYYERDVQSGSFFMKWYWQLRGEPTIVLTESLKLTDDHRFEHFRSTSCLPGSTYGTWTKENNILILKADSISGNNIMPEPSEYKFFMSNGRLYRREGDKKWVMKMAR